MGYRYRVFVSYSHEDRAIAERVVERLRSLDMRPTWDEDLPPGERVREAIEAGIGFSHVFVPIITAIANNRPWVHQEVGYATALRVPVLPLTIGELPAGLISNLHGKRLEPDLVDLPRVLTREAIETLVRHGYRSSLVPTECARTPHERTQRIVQQAERVRDFGAFGRVRQHGGLGSFSIPRDPVDHENWRKRDGLIERPHHYRELQREERTLLEEHAREAGCDLILDPTSLLNTHGPESRAVRFRMVIEYLESMPDDNVRVVLRGNLEPGTLIIVGDWFVAESLAPRQGQGYMQTVFTQHGPTVLRRIREFDDRFDQCVKEARREVGESLRAAAIRGLRAALAATID